MCEITIALKNQIEKEMKKIDELYNKVIEDLTKSYKIKHEKLTKEENDLKEKLQTEVTKIKENLECFWSSSNDQIKITEKLNKGIKKMENEEKNLIKNLAYISKMNKNIKEMKILNQQTKKSIKFYYQEDKNNIQFDEYFFGRLPTPKDVEFKNISYTTLEMYWKIDNINIININNNEIKYKVEMREENKQFNQIYEGNDLKIYVDKLMDNTNYEFRICSFYKGIIGLWTDILKIKTNEFSYDSNILKESPRKKELIQKLYEWTGFKKIELIYRGTRDGGDNNSFHQKCDNQGPTLILCKNDKDNIFGGYTSVSWTNDNKGYKTDKNSFLFTLTNIHNTEPTKFQEYNNNNNVYHYSNNGPTFGNGSDLYFYQQFLNNNNCQSGFPSTYKDTIGKGRSIFTGNYNNYNSCIKLREIEIFKIYK